MQGIFKQYRPLC